MCGFAGMLRWSGLQAEDVSRVNAAAEVLRHRGPDSSGHWLDTKIALAFRRLKVIDLSPAGEQPMSNEDGSLQVVFNGEIYNFKQLRDELRAQGHIFKSQTDTEVLLHLYEQHRDVDTMLRKLRGMFSFALWDSKREQLLLARDPLGVKPLYFAERSGAVAFASEAKALFSMGIKAELDPVAIDAALTYRYVPAPRSGFKNVEKLPPGHVAIASHGAVRYHRWHAEWPAASEDARAGDTEIAEQLQQAVVRRLVSDVPLGAWLSGGIDSGLVVAGMKEAGVPRHSFCAGFVAADYDERELARASAAHLQSEHQDFEIPPDVFKLLPQIVWHTDEPFFDSSCLPAFVLAEKTKPHATVVLSGDGGDEAFGGYERYVGMALLERYRNTPGIFRRLAVGFAKWRHPTASRQGWDRMLRWLEKCLAMDASGHHPYIAAMELFSAEQRQSLYGEAMLEATDGCDARETLESALLHAKQQRADANDAPGYACSAGVLQSADVETYLPGDVLHKVDRMSMAHGLEVRSPFLDVDLMTWALSLPNKVRLPGRETKPLLRRAAESRLPAEVVSARKRGFGVPLDDWFRGPLHTIALKLFEDSRLVADAIFKERFWESLWNEHQQEKAQHGERLYALLALELWYRTFIAGPVPSSRPEPLD